MPLSVVVWSLLLGQAKTRLRSIHKEVDEFLSFVV
jgi:hypothetical protein